MKLIGNLKKQVERTKNKEEARNLIEQAGMRLTDEELEMVAGGGLPDPAPLTQLQSRRHPPL